MFPEPGGYHQAPRRLDVPSPCFFEQPDGTTIRLRSVDLFFTDTGHVLELTGPPGLELELHVERHDGALLWFWVWSQSGSLLSYGRAASA